jgi:hypothetical protein
MKIRTIIAIGATCLLIGGIVGWLLKPCPCDDPYRYDGRITPPSDAELIATGTDTTERISITQRPAISTAYATPKRSRKRATRERDTLSPVAWTPPHMPLGSEADARLSVDTFCAEAFEDEYAFTTPYGDSIDVSVRFPERTARLARFVPAPDTMRTVTVTNDLIYEVADKRRFGLGVHVGYGVQVNPVEPLTVRTGIVVGVGMNYNLWEP